MPERAAIFIQRGVPTDKQEAACLAYCLNDMQYSVLWFVRPDSPRDAVLLARDNLITAVVTAFESRAAHQLAADIAEVNPHVRVEVVHPVPKVLEPPKHGLGTLGDLIVRWWKRGKSVEEIARDIDGETTDVRGILRRYGHTVPRRD